MRRWIIDDIGRVFRSGSMEFRQSLGYVNGTTGLETYAIENIGHIGISERGDNTHIQIRPAITSERALAGLYYWLLDQQHKPVILSWFDQIWHIERPTTAALAMSFLTHLVDTRTLLRVAHEPRLLSRPSRTAEARWSQISKSILPLVAQPLETGALRDALDRANNRRWMIIDVSERTSHIAVKDRGDGFPLLDSDLSRGPTAFQFEKIGDIAYREWGLKTYLDVAQQSTPRFDDIDAVVEWPRTGETRTRYWRILAPVHRTRRSTRLIAITGSDSSIDLRPELVQKQA